MVFLAPATSFPGSGRTRRRWKSTFRRHRLLQHIVPLAQLMDAKKHIITPAFAGEGPYTCSGNRFFVRNALEELDAPGEWYYDHQAGTVYFWPPDDQLGARRGHRAADCRSRGLPRRLRDASSLSGTSRFDRLPAGMLPRRRHCPGRGSSSGKSAGCTLTNIGRTAILLGEGSSGLPRRRERHRLPGRAGHRYRARREHPQGNRRSRYHEQLRTPLRRNLDLWRGLGLGHLHRRHHTVSHNLVHECLTASSTSPASTT